MYIASHYYKLEKFKHEVKRPQNKHKMDRSGFAYCFNGILQKNLYLFQTEHKVNTGCIRNGKGFGPVRCLRDWMLLVKNDR